MAWALCVRVRFITDVPGADAAESRRTGYLDRKSERRAGRHHMYSDRQRWFYFPWMKRNEAMLLKCFDSARDGRTRYTAHTGFANPHAPPDTPPRESIEVRTLLSFA
jgi:hypothetical protein